MGQCQSGGYPTSFSLQDLQDLDIGQKKEMSSGCGAAIEGTQPGSGYATLASRGFSFPNNSEFSWGGLGNTCNMCSDVAKGYGCECNKDNVMGNRGTVKRTAFTGDKTQCCISQTEKLIGGKTCGPSYQNQYKTADCDAPMISYCNQGDNWTKKECMQWVSAAILQGRDAPNAYISNWCAAGSNFKTDACQTWCSAVRRNPSMRSACDIPVQYYCKENGTDPLCTCLEPPENVTRIQDMMTSPKVCWYKPCINLTNDNYMTSTMDDDQKNCVSTVCLIEAGDINISGTDNKVEFNNSCATNILKPGYQDGTLPPPSAPPGLPPLPPTSGTNSDSTTDTSKYLIYGGIAFAVLFILVIFFMIIM